MIVVKIFTSTIQFLHYPKALLSFFLLHNIKLNERRIASTIFHRDIALKVSHFDANRLQIDTATLIISDGRIAHSE